MDFSAKWCEGIKKEWLPPFGQLTSLFQGPSHAEKGAFQKEVTRRWTHIHIQGILYLEQQKMALKNIGCPSSSG